MDPKKEAARVAYTLITNNTSVGLGDGSTIRFLASYLKDGIANGLDVKLYTSSLQTELFVREAGMTIHDIQVTDSLDLYFDGCDQIDEHLNALKSGAGIHTNEKLLASMATRFIILADASKFVSKLDHKFPLVLEVLPQATCFVFKKMRDTIAEAKFSLRKLDNAEKPVITRNGNYLIDCFFSEWPELEFVHRQCKNIAGVVEISLCYKMVNEAIIAGEFGIHRYLRENDSVSVNHHV
jgi:ribose 5-phosphate isomerase A